MWTVMAAPTLSSARGNTAKRPFRVVRLAYSRAGADACYGLTRIASLAIRWVSTR